MGADFAEWLAVVEEAERQRGAPLFSFRTKLEMAGISPEDIESTMKRIHQQRLGALLGAPYRGRN